MAYTSCHSLPSWDGVSLWGLGVPSRWNKYSGRVVRDYHKDFPFAELKKHCGRVLIKGGGFSLSLFVSNAITRLLLIDVGMAQPVEISDTPPCPSSQQCCKSFPSLSIPFTHTEAQMSTLKTVNFFCVSFKLSQDILISWRRDIYPLLACWIVKTECSVT